MPGKETLEMHIDGAIPKAYTELKRVHALVIRMKIPRKTQGVR